MAVVTAITHREARCFHCDRMIVEVTRGNWSHQKSATVTLFCTDRDGRAVRIIPRHAKYAIVWGVR
jgi:hypothetical protein